MEETWGNYHEIWRKAINFYINLEISFDKILETTWHGCDSWVVVRFHIPRQAFQDGPSQSYEAERNGLFDSNRCFYYGLIFDLSLKGAMRYAEDGLWKKGTPGHRLRLGFLHSYLLKAKNPAAGIRPSHFLQSPQIWVCLKIC